LPGIFHSILGPALSLLLVFRTNSAYDRFWEGRKSIGSVIIACRDIARLSTFLPSNTYKNISELLVTFMIVLKQHLQGERDSAELMPFQSSYSIRSIQSKRNRPVYVLHLLEKAVNEGLCTAHRINSGNIPKYIDKGYLDAFESLNKQIGVTERIVKQPAPLSYSRHASRFLSLYLFSLPFAILSVCGWFSVPLLAVISWAFVSILEIGHFIEDPFNKETQMIPLNQIISVICTDVSGELINFYGYYFIILN
jgi:putative membrane protein